MVRQIEVTELRRMLEDDGALHLLDVRTPQEWAIARVPGARPFDTEARRALAGLPRDTTLVFLCHHGVRSHFAAVHYAAEGFTDVVNVSGGIDAWSLTVDPAVPRY